MGDSEKVAKLKGLLSSTIQWYERELEEDRDTSYFYDMTVEHLTNNLSRADALELIETLVEASHD